MQLSRHSGVHIASNRKLLWRVTSTELRSRYAGSVFGVAWAALVPVLTLAIYGAVYTVILAVRVPGFSPQQYVLFIFAGLVPFLMSAESLSLGVASFTANRAILENTVFPIDLAGPKVVLGSQVIMAVGMPVLLVGLLATRQLQPTILLLPFVWLLHLLALVGAIWLLSLVNVLVRDLQSFMNALLMILFVASPIAYIPEMVPSSLAPLLALNPLSHFIIAYQKITVFGTVPTLSEWVVLAGISGALFAIGGWAFARAKRVLVDYV